MKAANPFENSTIKKMIRAHFVDEVLEHYSSAPKITYYDLPGQSFYCVKRLMQECGMRKKEFEAVGVERNKEIYRKGIEIVEQQNLPMTLMNIEDTSFWEGNWRKFNLFWFDLMCNYQTFQKNTLPKLLTGNHLDFDIVNPLMALTVTKGRELDSMNGLDAIDEMCGDREASIPSILNRTAHQYGYSLRVKHAIPYQDLTERHASPMIFFLFEIVQGTDLRIRKVDTFEIAGRVKALH